MITNKIIDEFSDKGYFIIDKAFSQSAICEMRHRLEEIILGNFSKRGRRFQVEASSGDYGDVNYTDMSYRGPDAIYRKIADLEYDDVFLQNFQQLWFQEICDKLVDDAVSIMRVTMMNKPPHSGTPLPWHQDLSVEWPVSIPPALVFWFPLDEANSASGSLQIIPESHKHGVIGNGHLLAKSMENEYAPIEKIIDVNMSPGDCLIFHPGILHRSGINRTDESRRAINVILMPDGAQHTGKKRPYPLLTGKGKLEPSKVKTLTSLPD